MAIIECVQCKGDVSTESDACPHCGVQIGFSIQALEKAPKEYRNPANGHVEQKSVPALWVLLFGPFYFLVSGIWIHALVMFILAVALFASFGPPAILLIFVMDFVYCLFAESIVDGYYLRKGWEIVKGRRSVAEAAADTKKCPFCAETIKFQAIACRYCGRDIPTAQQT